MSSRQRTDNPAHPKKRQKKGGAPSGHRTQQRHHYPEISGSSKSLNRCRSRRHQSDYQCQQDDRHCSLTEKWPRRPCLIPGSRVSLLRHSTPFSILSPANGSPAQGNCAEPTPGATPATAGTTFIVLKQGTTSENQRPTLTHRGVGPAQPCRDLRDHGSRTRRTRTGQLATGSSLFQVSRRSPQSAA